MRVGIIGLRHPHIETLARYILKEKRHEFVGWVESDPLLRAAIEKRFDVPTFNSTEELYNAGVQVVGVATINRNRGGIILEALARDVHVIADKPLMLSLEELREARSLQQVKGLQVGLLLTVRFNPHVRRLHEIITGGEIGEVVSFTAFRPHKLRIDTRPDWMFEHYLYGGLLVDLAIHDLDVLRWVCGCEAASINAWQSNCATLQKVDFYDNAYVSLRMENGVSAWIETNWLTPKASEFQGDCRYFVQGTKGNAEVKTARGYRKDEIIVTSDAYPATTLNVPTVGIQLLYDDFFAAIDQSREPLLTPEEVFQSTELSLRAQMVADATTRPKPRNDEKTHGGFEELTKTPL